MIPLTFIWGKVSLYWSSLINHRKTIISLSRHDSLPRCWLLPPYFITVTQQQVFLVLPQEGQQFKLIGLLNKLALSGTTFIHLRIDFEARINCETKHPNTKKLILAVEINYNTCIYRTKRALITYLWMIFLKISMIGYRFYGDYFVCNFPCRPKFSNSPRT